MQTLANEDQVMRTVLSWLAIAMAVCGYLFTAADARADLYATLNGDSSIYRIAANGTATTFVGLSAGLSSPVGLAFDTGSNLYVANLSNNTVSKITPGGVVSTFATVGAAPYGLAFDLAGNL